MLTKLDIVNEMLGLQGENPINTLDTSHPSVAGALLYLNNWDSRIQATRWWFNTEKAKLFPDVGTGFIKLPNNTLSFDIYDRDPNLTIRGDKLYNTDTRSYVFTRAVEGKLHRLVPFEELPLLARSYIAAQAKLAFQNNYDADPNKTRVLQSEVSLSYAALNSEHIRQVGANMFNRPGVKRTIADVWGDRRTNKL